ncbi:hypothetical protein [Mesorhizobium sp. URHB0026]
MNAHSKPVHIATDQGIFILSESGFYEPYEPDTETRYPGLIIISLSIIAWAAVGGIGYAVYQVWG